MREHEFRSKRIVENWYKVNDGSRTLFESVIAPEVLSALTDFKISGGSKNSILIGGLALSYWGIPRSTMDADFLFLSEHQIPLQLNGFKRIRPHAFQHNKTHVEIEVLDPQYLGLPHDVVNRVFETSVESDGIRVASKSGLVALKLFRLKRYDQGDIEQLISSGGVDITPFNLPADKIEAYNKIVSNM